uniref:Tr-type G domain-containing protein n=1 Tax=Macrostomum lignano TaxID=282301 RepID=A0A1I8F5T6_9PLAT
MDTCDMERFEKQVADSTTVTAACVLLVADASDARSCRACRTGGTALDSTPHEMILVFNKGDSPDADGILLSSIESYQQRLGCCYSVVTSTKTGQGIDLLRDRIGAACRQFAAEHATASRPAPAASSFNASRRGRAQRRPLTTHRRSPAGGC